MFLMTMTPSMLSTTDTQLTTITAKQAPAPHTDFNVVTLPNSPVF